MALEVLDDNEDIQPEVAESPTETKPVIDIAGGRLIAQKQLELLQKQLASRTNMPFNPILMKMAAGFLAPTKTGGFGESLGYAAQAGSEEAEKERARKVDNEKLQLEILKQQQTLRNQDLGFQLIKNRMNRTPSSGATGDAGATEATGASPTELMSTQQKAELVAKNPNFLDMITIDDDLILALGTMGMKDLANLATAIQKSQISRANLALQEKKIQQGDYDMGEVPNPNDPDKNARIPLARVFIPGFYKVAATGDTDAMNRYLAEHGAPGYFGKVPPKSPVGQAPTAGTPTAPTAGAPTEETEGFKPPPTISDREREKFRSEKRIESDIASDKTAKEQLFNNQARATEILPDANQIYRYATSPETKKVFGYMNQKGFLPGIVSIVQNGVSVGDFRIGMPQITDAMRKIDKNVSQKDLETIQALTQNLTRLELTWSANRKEGPITDFERQLFKNLGPMISDSPKTAALKSEWIIARAEMEDLTAKSYKKWAEKNPNGYVSDFKNSPEFNSLKKHYNTELGKITKKYGY